MKKSVIFLSILILFLSVSTVSAFLFGPPTAECKLYEIEIPDGYGTTDAYDPFGETGFRLEGTNRSGRALIISEVPSFDDYNRSKTEQIIETYKKDDIKTELCYDSEKSMYISGETYMDSKYVYGYNYTHTEFTKDGHNYVIINEYEGDYHDIDLKKDLEIARKIKESIWYK